MARAMWKGRIVIGAEAVGVKLYSAIEDRKIRFRLLHADDLVPVKQRWVRKSDGKEVDDGDLEKAYPVDRNTSVVLREDDLAEVEPEKSREIEVCRFVDPALIDDRWYDRPYYLGPDEDEDDYFALAEALEKKNLEGVCRWVMRKKRYVGSLRVIDGYPMLVTLRRSDQVISIGGIDVPKRGKPDLEELRLAKQLVSTLEDDFDPTLWQDEYRERVAALIEAKARGEEYEPPVEERPAAKGGLAESLKQSLSTARERKVA